MLKYFIKAPEKEEFVSFRDLHSWIQVKLAEKYRPGLRRIFESARPVLEALVIIERNLLTVGGVLCSGMVDESDQHGRRSDFFSNYDNLCCKAAVDRMVQSLEVIREFSDCADYSSFSRLIRNCKELVEILSNGIKTLNSNQISESHPLCREAVEQICVSLISFSPALSILEKQIDETRLITETLGLIKERIVGKHGAMDVESDRGRVLEAMETQSALMTARARFDSAKKRAKPFALIHVLKRHGSSKQNVMNLL